MPAPAFSSASVNAAGTVLTVRCTVTTPPIKTNFSTLLATGFTVTVDGTAVSLDIWSFGGDNGGGDIEIALADRVYEGQTVLVSYDGNSQIRDATVGNFLPAFTNQAVTNNSTQGDALVTLAEVKSFMGISTSTYDSILSTLIVNMSDAIVNYLGHSVFSATYTEYQDGLGGESLWVDEWPINSITSITLDANTSAPIVIDGDEFDFNGVGQVRFLPESEDRQLFSEGWRNIKIIYNAGWSTVPGPIKEAACMAVKLAYDQSKKDGSVQREKLGDYEYELATGAIALLHDFKPVRELLAPYRSLRV